MKKTGLYNRRRFSVPFILVSVLLIIAIAFGLSGQIVWPSPVETKTEKNGKLVVDVSGAQNGYVFAKGPKTDKRLKLRVSIGKASLTYDLNGKSEYEIIPLQLGNGKYTFELFQNNKGKKYAQIGKLSYKVSLNNEYAAFLCSSSQYVVYDQDSRVVALSDEICGNCSTDAEKLEAVREYIKKNYVYDYIKAVQVTAGTMPDIDYALDNHMGICQDLSALVAGLLRPQGIPTKFMIGYADRQYHAWNVVIIDGKEVLYDPTADLGGVADKVKYKIERYY